MTSISWFSSALKNGINSDADTVINLTNHSYFNLDGHKNWSKLDNHQMTVFADNFVDVDEFAIPKGGMTEVSGSKFDLRKGQMLTQEFLASVPGERTTVFHDFSRRKIKAETESTTICASKRQTLLRLSKSPRQSLTKAGARWSSKELSLEFSCILATSCPETKEKQESSMQSKLLSASKRRYT